jgi:outer membrane biosynthesis protein TonB
MQGEKPGGLFSDVTPDSVASLRQRRILGLVLIGVSLLLTLAACAPATAPAEPVAQPTAALAATATTAPAATATAALAATATTAPAATATTAPAATATTAPAATATAAPAATATAAPKPTEAPKATEKPASSATQPAAPAAPAASVSFARDIKPILDQKCLKCHGGEKTEEGFSVKTHQDLMKGSNNGIMVKAGSAADSEMIKLVVEGEMPKRASRLPVAEIKLLTDWVNAGAANN